MGASFLGMLEILFIALKLTHTITWPWLWVLAPIWIPFGLWVLFVVIVFTIGLIVAVLK